MAFLKTMAISDFVRAAHLEPSRRTKRRYIKMGYQHQISFYGVFTDTETLESRYARIEVLLNIDPTFEITYKLYHLFKDLKPQHVYTLWIYDQFRDAIKNIGRYK